MSAKFVDQVEWNGILEKEIPEAEMVLVGLGDEIDTYNGEKELALLESVLGECEAAWLMPEVYDTLRKSMHMNQEDEKMRILSDLADRLKGKNYYVVCMAGHKGILEIPWREGRLVAPCGFGTKKQCKMTCEGEEPRDLTDIEKAELSNASEEFLYASGFLSRGQDQVITQKSHRQDQVIEQEGEVIQGKWSSLPPQVREAMELIEKREKIRAAALEYKKRCENILGTCPICGAQEVLNVVQAPKYDQRGYLAEWTRYTKWLYGSMNRRLLILELGTSKKHPELLQDAFQKMSEIHTKAQYFICECH